MGLKVLHKNRFGGYASKETLELRSLLNEKLPESFPGKNFWLKGDTLNLPGFRVEVRSGESLDLPVLFESLRRKAKCTLPVLFFREKQEPWKAAVTNGFFRSLKRSNQEPVIIGLDEFVEVYAKFHDYEIRIVIRDKPTGEL